jgi:hypothetical protein
MSSFQRGAALSGLGLLFSLASLVLVAPAQAQDRYSGAGTPGYYDARQDGATAPYCCSGEVQVPKENPVDPCALEPQCPRYSQAPVQPEGLTLPDSFFYGGGGVGSDYVGAEGGGVVIVVGGGASYALARASANSSVSIRIGGGRGGHGGGGGGHGHPARPGGGGCGCGH